MIMKKVFLFSFLLLAAACFGQSKKMSLPLEFGIELDGKLKKIDPNTSFDSPTGVAYVGVFAELHLTNHLSGKLKVGLNNTYYHDDWVGIYQVSDNGYVSDGTFTSKTWIKQTFGISLEPRFYFFSTESMRKINFYAALPVGFESAPSWTMNFGYVRSELIILPSFGCRYDFTKHWGIETSGGLGWGRYYGKYNDSWVSGMKYGLSVGIRYAF